MTPAAIEAVVCPAPASSTIFSAQQAALSGNGLTEREFKSVQPIKDPVASCQKLTFDPQGFEGSSQLTLVVNEDWKFSIDLPAEAQIPGVKPAPPQPTPQPVAAQSIDQVNLTLDWTFVDAKRIAFGYTVTGFPEIPDASILGGTINVTDSLGFQYSYPYGGSSTIERDNNKSGTIHGTWSAILMEPLAAEEITLNIDITLDGSYGTDWNHMIGNINPTAGPFYPVKSDQWTVVPSGLIGTYHFETTSKVYPMTTLAPHEVVTANGIQMELLQAELTPSTSSFILCYNKPSAEDWMIGNTVLTSGIEQASINGYTLLSDANYVMKNPSILPPTSIGGQFVRCAEIDFQLGHSTQPRTIVLTVPALERSVPEVFPQVELDSALAKLKEQGIEMTYSITRGVGGGGGGPEYTKLPEGMTQLEAYDRFMDVIGYRAPGPWVFTFPYQP
jgi:hypothetical protein